MKTQELFEAVASSTWYHGSTSKIHVFDLSNISNPNATHQEGPGIYLTSSIDDAAHYGNFVHEVSAKVAKTRMMPNKRVINPLFIRGLITKAPNVNDNLTNYAEDKNSAINLAVKHIMDSYGPNDYREALEQVWYDHYHGEEQAFLSRMRSVGWDGFILNRGDIKHFICFNPTILTVKKVYER